METGKAYMKSLENLDADWMCESGDDSLEFFGIKILLVLLKVESSCLLLESDTQEARLVKRKAISESGNQDRRWAYVQRLIPCRQPHPHTHTDTQRARAFIDGGRGLPAQTAQSALMVIETGRQWSDHCLPDCFKCS